MQLVVISSQQNSRQHKLLFTRGPLYHFRLCVLILVSVGLMYADHHHTPAVERIHRGLETLTTPISYIVSWPLRMVDWVAVHLASQRHLVTENQQLHDQNLLLKVQLQKLASMEQENNQLRALLESAARRRAHVLAGQVLMVDPDPFVQQISLNKGTNDHIFKGQPVLDAHGVMGQVIAVSRALSRVLLLTDTRSAIPVQSTRNELRAIAVGTGANDQLQLINVPKTVDVKVGDVFVSSGLGQRYPQGYKVGVVTAVHVEEGRHFASITLKPSAQLDRSRQVLFVWPDNVASKHVDIDTQEIMS